MNKTAKLSIIVFTVGTVLLASILGTSSLLISWGVSLAEMGPPSLIFHMAAGWGFGTVATVLGIAWYDEWVRGF